jgi:hypothetical protein
MELLISVCMSISSLSEMPQVPEVQLFAAYFSQWHQTPINDYGSAQTSRTGLFFATACAQMVASTDWAERLCSLCRHPKDSDGTT